MTKDEIIEMARQVSFTENSGFKGCLVCNPLSLEAFAKLVAAKEREACAKVCDAFQVRDFGVQPAECAGAIRARGEQA